ncbi:hypothetical protein ACFV46_10145 [Streptomyces sp. NPDC059852]|uniref:hypothetical protein n=1 Tax=Streptomyces sp. NPDC059852 TaxID=3346972 RepID=UPI003652154F
MELSDVYEFLDQVRQRPGMWVRHRSLQHLDSILIGYRVAMEVHGIHEDDFPFWGAGDRGPFEEWFQQRRGHHSALGWPIEIERDAEAAGVPAIELFFRLLDEYRAEQSQPVESQPEG